MKKWAVLAGLLLAGCASSDGITLASGRQGYVIGCSGIQEPAGMASCLKKAGEACRAGYTVISQDPVHETRSMVIECK